MATIPSEIEKKYDIYVKEQTGKLIQDLNSARKERRLCDCLIKVGLEEIPAHRIILSEGCDYYRAMFTHEMRESQSGIVEMKGVDPECMAICIEYIYTGKVSVRESKIHPLLQIAQMLQLTGLFDALVAFLVQHLDAETFFVTRDLANNFGLTELQKKCEEYGEENFEAISQQEGFQRIDNKSLISLVTSEGNKTPEGIKLKCIFDWTKYEPKERKKVLRELHKHIDFPKVPVEYRRKLIEDEPLIHSCSELMRRISISVMDTANIQSCDVGAVGGKAVQQPNVTDYGATAMYSTSASKDNQLTLDKDIVDFMDLTMKERLDNLRNEFQINLRIVGEDVVAESHNDGESGINALNEFYHETIARVTQKSFPLPENLELEEIEDAIASIKNRYTGIHISLVGDGKQVLFIGDSPEDCSEAESQFRLKVHGLCPITQEWFANYSSVPLFVHQFPVTGLKVTIDRGDIAEQRVGAIVNAANARLQDGAGVTGAIFRAGGDEFRDRCQDRIYSLGRKLDIGEVVHTEACGRLHCDNVLHVVGPVWSRLPYRRRKEECEKIMDALCHHLIQYANHKVKSRSVAIPAIGTGIYGVPLSIFCNAMVKSIYNYQDDLLKREQTASLREIRIVNYDVQEANDIKRRFEEVFCTGAPESTVQCLLAAASGKGPHN